MLIVDCCHLIIEPRNYNTRTKIKKITLNPKKTLNDTYKMLTKSGQWGEGSLIDLNIETLTKL